jgi:uncharacterized protein with NRDE domain
VCTVILKWVPESGTPLMVGANRDERLDRPSEPFAFRNDILCPSDIRGGTWVGVNNRGMFVAITNQDSPHKKGKNSRGLLTLMALGSASVTDVESWLEKLNPEDYNRFNLVVACKERLVVFTHVGKRIQTCNLRPGLHVVTGFGIDTWGIPRCRIIRENLEGNTVRAEYLKMTLSLHGKNTGLTSVCIHDKLETHHTRSSCIVKALPGWSFEVQEANEPPCQALVWRILKLERA